MPSSTVVEMSGLVMTEMVGTSTDIASRAICVTQPDQDGAVNVTESRLGSG